MQFVLNNSSEIKKQTRMAVVCAYILQSTYSRKLHIYKSSVDCKNGRWWWWFGGVVEGQSCCYWPTLHFCNKKREELRKKKRFKAKSLWPCFREMDWKQSNRKRERADRTSNLFFTYNLSTYIFFGSLNARLSVFAQLLDTILTLWIKNRIQALLISIPAK